MYSLHFAESHATDCQAVEVTWERHVCGKGRWPEMAAVGVRVGKNHGTEGVRKNWIHYELDLANVRHAAARKIDVKVRTWGE